MVRIVPLHTCVLRVSLNFFLVCCALNVPYRKGLSDASFMHLFDSIFPAVIQTFRFALALELPTSSPYHTYLRRPQAIVLQLGADTLFGDRSVTAHAPVAAPQTLFLPASADATCLRRVSPALLSAFHLSICRCSCWEAGATTRLRP